MVWQGPVKSHPWRLVKSLKSVCWYWFKVVFKGGYPPATHISAQQNITLKTIPGPASRQSRTKLRIHFKTFSKSTLR